MCVCVHVFVQNNFEWQVVSKESACHEGDLGLIPGSGRSPGQGNGSPLQYSCLGNPVDRGAWDHKESDTTERLTLSLYLYSLFFYY